MQFAIPRGIIYHTVWQDMTALFKALFVDLDDRRIVRKFESAFAAYMGAPHGLAFPFARTALYFTLQLQKYPRGTKIIMPPITIKAILDVVLELGLIPIFVDIDPDTLCFNLQQLDDAITDDTKAILITYLYGMVPDLAAMMAICNAHKLFVIEDFSQCLNGQYQGKKVGTFGDVGIYSASSIKTLDTYGGGLLVTHHTDLFHALEQCQETLIQTSRIALLKKIYTDLFRNFVTRRFIFAGVVFPLLRMIQFFNPKVLVKNTGERDKMPIKYLPNAWFTRYSAFQAKVGLRSLPNLQMQDAERISNAEQIRRKAYGVFPKGVIHAKNVYWQTIAYFTNPAKALQFFGKHRIDSATTSLEKISTLRQYPYQKILPCADKIYSHALFIPSYPRLRHQDIEHIITTLNAMTHDPVLTEQVVWTE